MHVDAHLLDGVGDVILGEDEVLQCPDNDVAGRISDRGASGGDLALCVHRGRAELALVHASALEEVDDVLPLVKEQALRTTLNVDPQEVVERPRSFIANSCWRQEMMQRRSPVEEAVSTMSSMQRRKYTMSRPRLRMNMDMSDLASTKPCKHK